MAFTFIHTGDWHIGKSYGQFDDSDAGVLRLARLSAIDRIATVARDTGSTHVLVAGDVYDSDGLSDHQLRQAMVRLGQASDLVWHLLPGNHDPVHPRSVWSRLVGMGVPDNTRIHLEAGVIEIMDGVDLLVTPCQLHRAAEDPTAWIDHTPRHGDRLRVGLAHGSVHGFGGETEPDDLIALARAVASGLDYLALGDWHGMKQVSDRSWYAGTPEPDQFPENEPGYVLCVEIAGPGAAPQVRPIQTAQYRWYRHAATLASPADIDRMETDICQLDPDLMTSLVRLEVSGTIDMDAHAHLETALERLRASVFHLRERVGELIVDPASTLAGESAMSAELTPVIENLQQRAASGRDDTKTVQHALRQLARFSRTAQRTSVTS